MIEAIGEGLYTFKWMLSRYAAFIGYMVIFILICFPREVIEFIRIIAISSLLIFLFAYLVIPKEFKSFCRTLIIE